MKCGGLLLIALAILIPLSFWSISHLLNLDRTKAYIDSYVRSRVGGSFTYASLDVKLFPRPYAEVRSGRVEVPRRMKLTWKSLRLHPELGALFFGNLVITDLELVRPRLDFTVPATSREPATATPKSTSPALAGGLRKVLVAMMKLGNQLEMSDGELVVRYGSARTYRFQSLQLRLRNNGRALKLTASCRPGWAHQFLVAAEVDPDTLAGSVRLQVNRARVKQLFPAWSPDPSWHLVRSRLDGTLNLRLAGPDQWQADFKGSFPAIVFRRGTERQEFLGVRLDASLRRDQQRTTVIVHDLQAAQPALELHGRLERTREPGRVAFDFTGSVPKLVPVRAALLRLLGRHKVLRVIFAIVRGGSVPEIHFTSSGRSWRETGKGSHLRVFGRVRDAVVDVPHVAIEVSQVNGRFDVTRKILNVTDATLRWKRSNGFVKRLKLDLDKKSGPFFLDVSLDADLPQLPALLARLLHNRALSREMANIEKIEGRAKGRLVIRGSRRSPRVAVDIADFHLRGRYRRIPYPLRVSNGRFSYRHRRVTIAEVTGSCGATTFEDLQATLDWRSGYRLNTRGRRTRILLDQVYPWLLSYAKIRQALKRFPHMSGKIELARFWLAGPLLQPRRWRFETTGRLLGYTCDATFFPAPLTALHGRFRASERDLDFANAGLRLMKSRGTGTGKIVDYLKGVSRLELLLDGTIHGRSERWLHRLFQLPERLRLKTPLAVKAMKIVWEPRGRTTLNGGIRLPPKVRLDLDVTRTAKKLNIDRLAIRDQDSDCELKIHRSDGKWAIRFKGLLKAASLDRILVVNSFLKGVVQGDISVRLPTRHWTMLTAQGTLQGSGLQNPGTLFVHHSWPLAIDSIRIQADNNRIKILTASLRWDKHRYTASGEVFLSRGKTLFDLDLHVTDLSWSWVKKELGLEQAGLGPKKGKGGPFPSYRGIVRLKADHFHYGHLAFAPFAADVTVGDKGTEITITKAVYCGVSMPTEIKVYPNNRLQIMIRAAAKDLDLNRVLTCIWSKSGLMSGTCDFEGEFSPSGNPGEEISSIEGRADFKAWGGRIYRFNLLSKIFALLNLSEIFRGKLPDLAKEGFAYNTFILKGPIEEGRFVMEEGYIDGASMDIFWQGECDLGKKTLDMTVLVAPFKTVDSILKHVPVLGKLMNGSTVSIPIKVTGPLDNPSVLPLGPSAVGSSIFKLIERILKLPNTIVQPLLKK